MLALCSALALAAVSGCDSLWDAEMDVSPDYYGVGVTVPSYGYYPGPPAIDPTIWGPRPGSWNWGGYPSSPPVSLPPLGVRPGGNSWNPGFRPNGPVGNVRPGYSRPSTTSDDPASPPPAQSTGNMRPAEQAGRH